MKTLLFVIFLFSLLSLNLFGGEELTELEPGKFQRSKSEGNLLHFRIPENIKAKDETGIDGTALARKAHAFLESEVRKAGKYCHEQEELNLIEGGTIELPGNISFILGEMLNILGGMGFTCIVTPPKDGEKKWVITYNKA